MKKLLAGAFAICAAATLVSSADAAPSAVGTGGLSLDSSLVLPVASSNCSRDDRGWRHMRGDRRVSCKPSRPRGEFWGWRSEGGRSGWWHRRENRWND